MWLTYESFWLYGVSKALFIKEYDYEKQQTLLAMDGIGVAIVGDYFRSIQKGTQVGNRAIETTESDDDVDDDAESTE